MLRARWIAGLLAAGAAAAVIAGCGSSGSGGPLGTELSYLPANSPLVLTLETDPNSPAVKNTMSFINRFPFAPLLESQIITRLRQVGLDYNADIKPLFGYPVALAFTGSSLAGQAGSRRFVVVWMTKSASALNSLIHKSSSGFRKLGGLDGATLYGAGGTVLAVNGDTLVLGPSRAVVANALAQHARGGGMTTAQYSRNTASLPSDAEIRVFGNVRQLLTTSPQAAKDLRIPWLAAVRGYGVSIGPAASGVTVRFHIDTSGSTLTAAQLPIAPGSAVPELPSGVPVAAGLRDPQHLIAFARSASQLSNPGTYAAFLRRQAALRAHTGTDLIQLLRQITGKAAIASNGRAAVIRADAADPKSAARILAALAKDPRDAFQTKSVTAAGGLYVFARPAGPTTIGVVGNQIVYGAKATPGQVRSFATAPAAPAANAQGPFAFSVSISELLALAGRRSTVRIPPALLGSLGDLTGWISNTPSGLDGTARLAFK